MGVDLVGVDFTGVDLMGKYHFVHICTLYVVCASIPILVAPLLNFFTWFCILPNITCHVIL